MKALYTVALLFVLASCNSNKEKGLKDISSISLSSEYQMEIYDPAVADLFQETLKKAGVYFEVVDENKIKLKVKDQKQIDRLFFKLSQGDLPVGHSISLKIPGLEGMVIQQLENKGIPYTRKKRYGDFWIVWSAEDSAKVDKIIEQCSTEARKQLIKNYEKGIEQ